MASIVTQDNVASADEIEIELGVIQPSEGSSNSHTRASYNVKRNEDITPNNAKLCTVKQGNDNDDIQVITYNGDADQTVNRQSYHINRPLFSEKDFQNEYKENDLHYVPYNQKLKKKIKNCRCGKSCCKGCITSTFPIFGWLPRYAVRKQLLRDIIAGTTVCVMNIPQGMAYAMLASLPAVYGLYLSFFAPLVYAVTGTSRDLAVGTYAIGSLMVRAAIQDVVPQYPLDEPPTNYMEYNNTNTTAISPPEWNREQELVDAAVIMALLVGVIQLAMGILRLGWVTVYLSDPFISGYLTGAACRVFTSQIDAMVGVKVRGHPGLLGLVYTYRDLLASAADWNYVTILISICCVLILISIKEIETKYKRQLHGYPLGSEIIVVILGVLFSYLLNLEEDYNVKVVGDLPAGVPAPSLPSTTYLTSLIGPAFPLAIVSYAIAIVVVSLFAQKKRYKIDANQELIAYGATNVVVSFLSGFPASAALDRSLVQDSAGGTSQIAGLVNSALMLVVLLWIGPLFEALPTAILASIIVVTLKEVFRKILAVPKLFKADLLDFHVWWVSCVAVLLFNVDFGLVIGIGYSIFMHVWRTQEPPCALLGRVDGTDLYKDIKQYSDATESRGIKIFCMQSSLYFVNIAHFMAKMYKLTGINPRKILQIKAREEEFEERNKKKQSKEMKKEGVLTSRETGEGNILTRRQGHYSQLSATVSNAISDNMEDDKDVNEWDNEHDEDIHGLEEGDGLIKEDKIHTIIIDCSSLNFIDSTALSGLRQLFKEYHKLGIKILLANCKKEVRDFLSRCNFYEDVGYEEKCCVFVTVHDAVLSAEQHSMN